jgi:hypothetical protein
VFTDFCNDSRLEDLPNAEPKRREPTSADRLRPSPWFSVKLVELEGFKLKSKLLSLERIVEAFISVWKNDNTVDFSLPR